MIKISYVDDGGTPELIFEGNVSASRISHAFDAVISGPEFRKGVGLVIDATDLRHEFSHDEIRNLALHAANGRDSLGRRMAVVVSSNHDLQFGLARMFSTYADLHDLTVGVFTTTEEALRWIGAVSET